MSGEIKSNQLKEIPLPNDFTDDDKDEYRRLLNMAKIEHADVYEKEKWIVHYGIIMHIRKQKGEEQPISEDELKEIISRYELKQKEVICKGDEIPYLYDKENNPIFKDDDYFFKIKDEEGKVADTTAESEITLIRN